MYILANPLIGKSLVYSNLKLSDTGLYYKVRIGEETEDIFLTDDFLIISNIIEMDLALTEKHETNDTFFDYVAKSKFFNPEKLQGKYIDNMRDCKMLVEFEEYVNRVGMDSILQYRKDNNVVFERVSIDTLKSLFPHLEISIKEAEYWLNNKKHLIEHMRKKFNGKIILHLYPDFYKPNLELVFADMNAAFSTVKERALYIYENDLPTLIERFVAKYINN